MESSEDTAKSLSIEDIIEKSMGQVNCAQIVQAILASVPVFFDYQQTFISVFADAEPAWHCANHDDSCKTISDICRLPKSDWAWNGNMHRSIISEWGLECSSSLIKGLPATSFFLGCLLSGFVIPTLGDSSLGRKNLLFISSLIMLLSAFASAFSPNIWVHSVFRFISGVGRVSISGTAFVLLSEKVGRRWRGQLLLLGYASLTLGLLSITGISYLARESSWRGLYLWTSVPGIIGCMSTHFFLYESPRWLFMRGRNMDAIAVLKQIGSVDHLISSTLPTIQEFSEKRNPYSSIKILFKRRWAIQRLLASVLLSFGVGLMYYGMFLGVGDLGFDVYLITTINALLFFSTSVLVFLFCIQTCNRRSSLLGLCAVSGAASITCIPAAHFHQGIVAGLEFVVLFCSCMVFHIVFMYVVEMFPTCIRNSATALSRQALFFASVFVPVLVVIGKRNKPFFHGVFGVGILVSGLFVLCLPETRGKPLCDTMEEQEARDNADGCLSNSCKTVSHGTMLDT